MSAGAGFAGSGSFEGSESFGVRSGGAVGVAGVSAVTASAATGTSGLTSGFTTGGFFGRGRGRFFGSGVAARADLGSASGRLATFDEAIAGAVLAADAGAAALTGGDMFAAGEAGAGRVAVTAALVCCAFAARVRSTTSTATIATTTSAIGTSTFATLMRGFTICESSGPGASGGSEGRDEASAMTRIEGAVAICVRAYASPGGAGAEDPCWPYVIAGGAAAGPMPGAVRR